MATIPSNGLESPGLAPPLAAVTPRSNADETEEAH